MLQIPFRDALGVYRLSRSTSRIVVREKLVFPRVAASVRELSVFGECLAALAVRVNMIDGAVVKRMDLILANLAYR